VPPYFSMGESIINYLGAVGIKLKLNPMERAAFFSAWATKKLRGPVYTSALYGNTASRMSEFVPSDGAYAYGGILTSMRCTNSRLRSLTAANAGHCCTRSNSSSTSGSCSDPSGSTSGRVGSDRGSRSQR
jgi:hypothetical protein